MVTKPAPKVKKKSEVTSLTSEAFDYLYNTAMPEGVDVPLASISERDSVWDIHRLHSAHVSDIYALNAEFERYSERIEECSGYLKFGLNEDNGFILKEAIFCRVRHCTTCQWRRSLLWKAMMYQTYDKLREQYPTHRFVFLTLTVKNCEIGELRSTLQHMNKSWQRLIKRKEFMTSIDGWVRTTEITRPKDPADKNKKNKRVCPVTGNTHAHPHFHVLLMVKPSYFSHGYIKKSRWGELWMDCLRVDYIPVIDIRTVKPKKPTERDADGMGSAIAETLKYAVKPDDIIHDMENPKSRDWFYELTRQTHKLRFVATGGLLKDALKPEQAVSDKEMINTGASEQDTETDDRRLNFTFYKSKGGYIYNPEYNEQLFAFDPVGRAYDL